MNTKRLLFPEVGRFSGLISDSRNWLQLVLLAVFITPFMAGCSTAKDASESGALTQTAFDPTYGAYAELLAGIVHGDRVDYVTLTAQKEALGKVVASFGSLTQDSLLALPVNDQIAFYINAYNAITLYSIVERYPKLKSIKAISGVWDKREWDVAGEKLTLNDIENEKLRPNYDEPRIHFGINCASIGCPPLNPTPFLGATLDEQLAVRARAFFNDPERFSYDSQKGKLHVTRIFKWFGDDFLSNENPRPKNSSFSKKDAAIVAFIAAQMPENIALDILSGAKSIDHMDYDWKINDILRDK